jgi:hypothetical protein
MTSNAETTTGKGSAPIYHLKVVLLGSEPPIWRLLQILPPDAAAAGTALCLDGARACPPEDCGGIWGYADLLKILKNRKHPEHKTMKEWIGRELDAEAFDIRKTNLWLRKLKWPRATEAQLRKVLMGRDDYQE